MSDPTILREYLVAFGFKVDPASVKKADTALAGFDKKVWALGKTVIGLAGAAQAMVAVFAHQMEKLYYASRRTGASVGNIQALEYGAKQIGLTGESARASLEGMAKAIRTNPGILEFITGLGVKTEGRDTSDILKDTVAVLGKMPHFLGSQFASMFGMDEETFLMMVNGQQEMAAADAKRKQMAKELGVDTEKAALAAKEYSNAMREVWERIGLAKDALAIGLLPVSREVLDVTNQVLAAWTKLFQESAKGEGFWSRLRDGFLAGASGKGKIREGVTLTPEAQARIRGGAPLPLAATAPTSSSPVLTTPPRSPTSSAPVSPSTSPSTAHTPASGSGALFDRLEQRYSLPPGILDRMWKQESSRGKRMIGPVTRSGERAQGHFQWMRASAQDYDVKDPFDLEQSATGTSRYLQRMLRKYGGDIQKATASYNWGPGNLDRYGLGRAPKETRDYVANVAQQPIILNQKTDIHIPASPTSAQTARDVASEQMNVNAELTRNMKGSVQ